LILLEDKRRTLELVQEAIASGARKNKACETICVSIKSLQRWDQTCNFDGRKGAGKKVPRKLTEEERQKVKDLACE